MKKVFGNISPALHHNSLIGLAACIQKHAKTIAASPTATDDAKSLADGVQVTAMQLERSLRKGRKS